MRIITYADPFHLKDQPELWELITSHPHYCASDTLVQGMARFYGRSSFSILRPLEDLIKTYLGKYTDNPVNDMKIYMAVSDLIRAWPDSPMKQSFQFNKTSVVEAIRLLLPLECDTRKIHQELLTEEQRRLLDLYDGVRERDCYQAFASLQRRGIIDFEEAVRRTAAAEILHLARTANETLGQKIHVAGIQLRQEDLGEIRRAADVMIDYYQTNGFTERANEIRAARNACELNTDRDYYKTIIINGVHRFTPEIIYLLKNLTERLHVEVIFLIPYAEGLPAVYDTWKNVYAWTHLPFEHVGPLPQGYHAEAEDLARVLQGESPKDSQEKKLFKYDNLTTFAINVAGKTFKEARESLDKMKTQYYAVQGTECNELLKMFYPKQFKSKPFLSYPIGQLILGIYRMWDFDRQEMIFDVDSLMECAVSGIFQEEPTVLETLRKTRLYFRGAETLGDYQERIGQIMAFQGEASTHPQLSGLKHLSFLNLSLSECMALQEFLNQLSATGIRLFKGKTKNKINYIEHFRELMNIITEAASSESRMLPEVERNLILSIREQLNTSVSDYVEGSIQDVSDALAFFLSSHVDKETSNWIVRDFEQIDGAVLLSPSTHAQTYHFALLSNEHMLKQPQDELPWPLNADILDAYEEIRDDLQAISASVRERRSFLKFILFYGVYFSNKKLEFSYIAEEKDEKQTPYYLLSAMGFQTDNKIPDPKAFIKTTTKQPPETELPALTPDDEAKELFSICPFKYLLNRVLGAEISYDNEYHITYFLRYYLTYLGRNLEGKNTTERVQKALSGIRNYFPFLGATAFGDLVRDAAEDLERYKHFNPGVHRKKQNFLVAAWNTEDWKAQFNKPNLEKEMYLYMKNPELYPADAQLPRHSFCDYCSYQNICMRDFYMERTKDEEETEAEEA